MNTMRKKCFFFSSSVLEISYSWNFHSNTINKHYVMKTLFLRVAVVKIYIHINMFTTTSWPRFEFWRLVNNTHEFWNFVVCLIQIRSIVNEAYEIDVWWKSPRFFQTLFNNNQHTVMFIDIMLEWRFFTNIAFLHNGKSNHHLTKNTS